MNVIELLKEIISEVSGLDQSELVEDMVINEGGLTSIEIIEIIAEMEHQHGIELDIDDMDINNYLTLGDLMRAYEKASGC